MTQNNEQGKGVSSGLLSPLARPTKKGGFKKMAGPTIAMEVERIMNLVRGFGWEKAKEEIIGDEIHLEIVKKSPAAEEAGSHVTPS